MKRGSIQSLAECGQSAEHGEGRRNRLDADAGGRREQQRRSNKRQIVTQPHFVDSLAGSPVWRLVGTKVLRRRTADMRFVSARNAEHMRK